MAEEQSAPSHLTIQEFEDALKQQSGLSLRRGCTRQTTDPLNLDEFLVVANSLLKKVSPTRQGILYYRRLDDNTYELSLYER